MVISAVEMKTGQVGTINNIAGGQGLRIKLNNLGLNNGTPIKKISDIFNKGPITLEILGSKVAVGHKMGKKIMVDVKNNE